MDALTLLQNNIYVVAVVLVSSLAFILSWKKKTNYPPGPYNLPLVGYLPFLGQQPHEKLTELAKKYGSIFSLRLGLANVVVLADFESVKEAFNKSATADRPPNLFHFLPGELGIASINGDDWIEQRKYSIKTFRDLGLGKSKWETQVQEEVKAFVRFLKDQKGRPLAMKIPLVGTVSNNILSLLFGYTLPLDDPKRIAFNKGFDAFPKAFMQTGLKCLIPKVIEALRKIGIKVNNSIKEDLVAFNSFVRGEIQLKKDNMNDENEEGYVYRYLADLKDDSIPKHSSYNEKSLVGNVQSYIFGGVETTMTTLHWLFLAMAAYPDIQHRIQNEIDTVLGDQDDPQWPQHSSLPYTYAAILEVMRWRTLTPLNITHLTTEDVKIGGYDIPKGTALIGLLHALHRDARYWPDPEVFRPERFLYENNKVVPKRESWAPFSIGKRHCPGEIVGLIELFLYFASVLQKFDVRSEDPSPDMKGTLGLALQPIDDKTRLRFDARHSKRAERSP